MSNAGAGIAAMPRFAASFIALVAGLSLGGLGFGGEARGAGSVAPGPSVEGASCSSAIQAAERRHRIPARLLHAIGLVESGRASLAGGPAASWPWTVNIVGAGRYLDSRSAAIAAVEQARNAGVQSIDIGCMQVNLLHHPTAFASLEQAFDPQANADYAAAFLASLFRETGSWPAAAQAYHSREADRGARYGQRVMAAWPLSKQYGAVPDALERATGRRVDPRDVYTPEFRARVAADAARRGQRDAALRGLGADRAGVLARSSTQPGLARSAARPAPRGGRGALTAVAEQPGRQPLRF